MGEMIESWKDHCSEDKGELKKWGYFANKSVRREQMNISGSLPSAEALRRNLWDRFPHPKRWLNRGYWSLSQGEKAPL